MSHGVIAGPNRITNILLAIEMDTTQGKQYCHRLIMDRRERTKLRELPANLGFGGSLEDPFKSATGIRRF